MTILSKRGFFVTTTAELEIVRGLEEELANITVARSSRGTHGILGSCHWLTVRMYSWRCSAAQAESPSSEGSVAQAATLVAFEAVDGGLVVMVDVDSSASRCAVLGGAGSVQFKPMFPLLAASSGCLIWLWSL